MGQFKPMVKMETTEPSVILKLKKGGHVNMKKGGMAEGGHKKMAMGGGAMESLMGTPALVGRPAVNAPVRAPGKPSMAARRKSMMAKPAMAKPAMPMGNPSMPAPMKKGGKAEGGESKAAHKAEMSAIKGVDKKLTKHASMAASKGHKGLKAGGMATGGVTNGQGGYKTGGVALGNGGGYKDGGMTMVEKGGKMVPDFAADGKGKMKMGGKACATGGVALGNGGGYKMGGKASKKAYATGGTVNSGKPVAMPQGAKKPSQPVSTNRVSGTFKSGGKVTPAEGRLRADNKAENSTAMKQAKAQSNDVYSKYQKMKDGGKPVDMSKGAYDASSKHSRELEDALNPLSMVKELAGKAKDYFMPKSADSVTKTKESVTVTPATKKRGGGAC
jgi:hypothetical protein